ncbi:transketolase [Polymorphobacter multimanifer]|uniref:transketolase n=1 Tax=Polymorphobacter multimanifer TaxID=1070431 RepID=UPI001664CAD8|nr:transketolase [Polymorphobacter multimanifer]
MSEMRAMANAVRALAMDAVVAANSGHSGMPMGMADAATVLFTRYLKYDPAAPHWADRDRFVLSAGHGSMLIYALLHLTGYARPTLDDIKAFRQLGSPCAGHPEVHELEGVETTTGPLGQGLATAVGMAMAERALNSVYGDGLVDHRTWVVAGDGCLMEGISHEAIGLAGHLQLRRLNVLWDDNGISIDGPVSLSSNEDVRARFVAAGWHVVSCDGHDSEAVAAALAEAMADARPSLVACKTTIGYGSAAKGGTAAAHGALGAADVEAVKAALGWPHGAFEVPEDIRASWRAAGGRGAAARAEWEARLAASGKQQEFDARMAGDLPAGAADALASHAVQLRADAPTVATRKASEMVLGVLNPLVPALLGGAADLTGSNFTRTGGQGVFGAPDYAGRHVHYGIREFGMAAAMNGMALHGGIIPYGGTFLVFSDYARAAIRLSAIQTARAVYVFTHDSIGVGEDGPTHQPIEHVMSLRLIPGLAVYRPADAVETAEAWALALEDAHRPSVLALSRQNLPAVRRSGDGLDGNMTARGAYRLKAAEAARRVVLIGTGSEVEVTLAAAAVLESRGIGADVVSMPCWERFAEQPLDYRRELLPANVTRVAVEAGVTLGWERWTGDDGLVIGIDSFGASGPAGDLYKHFGLTGDAVAARVIAHLG